MDQSDWPPPTVKMQFESTTHGMRHNRVPLMNHTEKKNGPYYFLKKKKTNGERFCNLLEQFCAGSMQVVVGCQHYRKSRKLTTLFLPDIVLI